MKLIVNGSTVSEMITEKVVKVREFKRSEIIEFDFNTVDIGTLDKIIGHIKTNKKMYARLVIMIALSISSTTLTAYAGGITDIALEVYEIVKEACFGICLLGAAVEFIRCVVSGTVEQLGKVAVKYISFALMIKFLPKAVDMIFRLGGN